MNAASRLDEAKLIKGVSATLTVLQSRERLKQISNSPEPRYAQRLSDLITTSFYEACRIGNLDAARQLMEALECETLRSIRLTGVEKRHNGNDLAAVQTRYSLEAAKRVS